MKFLPTFNDMFDDLFHDPFNHPNHDPFNHPNINTMRTDIVEKDNYYVLNMELPGYQKEDIQMSLNNGYLTINATKNIDNEQKDQNGRVLRRERYSGSCSRNFYIGEEIRQEDIKASFDNGELKISIPKEPTKQVEQKKYIPID